MTQRSELGTCTSGSQLLSLFGFSAYIYIYICMYVYIYIIYTHQTP